MINHVTYHVPAGTLDDPNLETFMQALGLEEVPADDPFEHGYKVRWFRRWIMPAFALHLVEDPATNGDCDLLRLGHFCISGNADRFERLRRSPWLNRDSGSGRIWLRFANLRVEVRP